MRPTQQGAAARPGNAGARGFVAPRNAAPRAALDVHAGRCGRRAVLRLRRDAVCLLGRNEKTQRLSLAAVGRGVGCSPPRFGLQSAFDRACAMRVRCSRIHGDLQTGSEGLLVGFEAPREVGARRAFQAPDQTDDGGSPKTPGSWGATRVPSRASPRHKKIPPSGIFLCHIFPPAAVATPNRRPKGMETLGVFLPQQRAFGRADPTKSAPPAQSGQSQVNRRARFAPHCFRRAAEWLLATRSRTGA